MNTAVQLTYLAAIVLFILGLKWMSSPATARRGNLVSSVGMLLASSADVKRAMCVASVVMASSSLVGSFMAQAPRRHMAR